MSLCLLNLQKGVVCVWQTDSRGGLNPIRQYRKKGSISALIYCVFSARTPEFTTSTTGPNPSTGTVVVHNGNNTVTGTQAGTSCVE